MERSISESTLPVDLRTGIRAIAVLNGRPIWPILGADGADDPDPDPPADPDSTVDPPSNDPDPADDPPAAADPDPDPSTTASKDTADWKKRAREWERRAKANAEAAKKLAEVEEANKTAEQKAKDAAERAEQRAKAATERVVKAELKAALTGVVDDPESIIEDLNLARYVDDDDEVDGAAIDALREKYEALKPPEKRVPRPNRAQGVNGSKEGEKPLTRADVARMGPDEINKARREGRLSHLGFGRK